MNSKYEEYWYWGNMVLTDQPLWDTSFRNLDLSESSIFIYSVIIDVDKNLLKNCWAYYPDEKSLLGFIEHVFLPTAFFTWIDEEQEGFNIPVATSEEVLDAMVRDYGESSQIELMRSQVSEIESIRKMDKSNQISAIEGFSSQFNDAWQERDGKLLYMRTFRNTDEVGEFVFKSDNFNCFEEVVEEDIGMKREEWMELCKSVYDNKFLRKKFIDILNCKIGCLV